MSSTLFVKGSTSKTCIIALAVQAREDHRHHPVHAVRGSSDKGRPVRVGQKSADTNSTRCNAAQSMASAGYTAPPSSHEGSQQPSQGQAGAAKRIQGRNLPNLFFPSNARWLSPGRLSSRKDNCILQIHRIDAVATSVITTMCIQKRTELDRYIIH